MAKKTRRARKATQQQRVQQGTGNQHETAPAAAVAATPRVNRVSRTTPTITTAQAAISFREEYHYVVADLKRVGILAVVMFAVLIGLALALPALGI
jgi:hypothetical protein